MGGGDIDSEVASVRFGFYTENEVRRISVKVCGEKIARKQQPWLVAAQPLPPPRAPDSARRAFRPSSVLQMGILSITWDKPC